jgi:hypothetical protein
MYLRRRWHRKRLRFPALRVCLWCPDPGHGDNRRGRAAGGASHSNIDQREGDPMSMRSVAILAMAAAASLAHAAGPVAYSVRELPALNPSDPCTGQPVALSPTSGLVVGTSCRHKGGQAAAVLWDDASARALHSSPASPTQPTAVNDRGLVAGTVDDINLVGQAVLWGKDGRAHSLPPLAEGDSTEATGISATGDVAGLELNRADNRWIPVRWHQRQPTVLALPAGQVGAYPTAMSTKGVMAGRGYDATGASSAVLWNAGTATVVGPRNAIGLGVNDAGQVVGEYRPFPGVDGAFLAVGATTTILPMRSASAINSAGVIVGDSNGVAVRWIAGDQQALTGLLDAEAQAAHWSLFFARAIDDEGRIVATGQRSGGEWTNVLLVPAAP